MTDATADPAGTASGPMLAADGRPLKVSLNRALRAQKLRALVLIAPLLLFIVLTFLLPIGDMLFRSVENQIVPDTLPETVAAIEDWDARGDELPDEAVFAALHADLLVAVDQKLHTRLGSRLNYENSGISSLMRKTGRDVEDMDPALPYKEQFLDTDEDWGDIGIWRTIKL
jgi:putative spermidine/putrescine transport system permease protein